MLCSGRIRTQNLSERISMSRGAPIKTRNAAKRTSGRTNSIRLGEGLNAMPKDDKVWSVECGVLRHRAC